ncbi:MAG TPA: transcription antitermination factor NusB [Longimicrobiales bacterium]
MRERSRARGWALQILYAWESRGRGSSLDAVLAEFERERHIARDSRMFLAKLVHAVDAHVAEIDRTVEEALTNWRLERLSVIDRNILRLAAAEMLYVEDVPPRVSIQEAIVLAEKYGTADSPRFVNGVLDALLRRIEGRSPARRAGE